MRLSITTLACMSSLVAALPRVPRDDGRGATVYDAPNYQGDNTAIPGNNYCTDLFNLFGMWDGRIESLGVAAGYQCSFFINHACVNNGPILQVTGDTCMPTLNQTFNQNIHSAICAPVSQGRSAGLRAPASSSNNVAVKLFSGPGMHGTSVTLSPPADDACMDLNAQPLDFANKTRSLIVYKQNACDFFTDFGCPAKGQKVTYSGNGVDQSVRTLPGGTFDQRIRSVKCRALAPGGTTA